MPDISRRRGGAAARGWRKERPMTRLRGSVHVALTLGLLLGVSAGAGAQVDRGTLTGTVSDSSGGVVAGATVKAIHVATNFERTVTTSPLGSYTIPQLPVGAYVVVVTAKGFQTTTLENIEVTAGASVRVDGTLAVGGLSDTVTVAAESNQ